MSMKSNKELWATAMRAALRVEFITNIKELSLYFVEFGSVFLYILIQLVKVYISQYRADDTTLRCATVSIVELPFFNISSFQKLAYQSDESFIRNAFRKNAYQYIMVYIIKEAFYISLYKPFCTAKLLLDMS